MLRIVSIDYPRVARDSQSGTGGAGTGGVAGIAGTGGGGRLSRGRGGGGASRSKSPSVSADLRRSAVEAGSPWGGGGGGARSTDLRGAGSGSATSSTSGTSSGEWSWVMGCSDRSSSSFSTFGEDTDGLGIFIPGKGTVGSGGDCVRPEALSSSVDLLGSAGGLDFFGAYMPGRPPGGPNTPIMPMPPLTLAIRSRNSILRLISGSISSSSSSSSWSSSSCSSCDGDTFACDPVRGRSSNSSLLVDVSSASSVSAAPE